MDYLLVIVVICSGLAMFVGGLLVSRLVAPHRPTPMKEAPYECGEESIGDTWGRFHVGYYLFALLFLIFEVEVAFLYPWAVVLRETGVVGLIEGGIFVVILVGGLAYAWKKGALEWE